MRRFAVLVALAASTSAAEPLVRFTDAAAALEVRALSAPLTVGVRYGAALDPASLRATLNGDDVSAAFAPAPGAEETVTLPFVPGVNRLEIEAAAVAADGEPAARELVDREITYARLPADVAARERMKSLPELRQERWKDATPEAPPAEAGQAQGDGGK